MLWSWSQTNECILCGTLTTAQLQILISFGNPYIKIRSVTLKSLKILKSHDHPNQALLGEKLGVGLIFECYSESWERLFCKK